MVREKEYNLHCKDFTVNLFPLHVIFVEWYYLNERDDLTIVTYTIVWALDDDTVWLLPVDTTIDYLECLLCFQWYIMNYVTL